MKLKGDYGDHGFILLAATSLLNEYDQKLVEKVNYYYGHTLD